MAEAQWTRALVMNAIADDYEDLTTIFADVRQWAQESGESVTMEEVVETLLSLTRERLAGAYILSSEEPYATAVDPESAEDVKGIHFLLTEAGKNAMDG